MISKKRIIFPIAYMLLIFFLSSIPDNREDSKFVIITQIKPEIQNILHLPLFAILTFLWFSSLKHYNESKIWQLKIAIVISISYGLMDEVHQYFVQGRYMLLLDFELNIIGVGLISIYLSLLSHQAIK